MNMEPKYATPKVTIDLEEYNSLLLKVKEISESVQTQKENAYKEALFMLAAYQGDIPKTQKHLYDMGIILLIPNLSMGERLLPQNIQLRLKNEKSITDKN